MPQVHLEVHIASSSCLALSGHYRIFHRHRPDSRAEGSQDLGELVVIYGTEHAEKRYVCVYIYTLTDYHRFLLGLSMSIFVILQPHFFWIEPLSLVHPTSEDGTYLTSQGQKEGFTLLKSHEKWKHHQTKQNRAETI